MNLIKKINGSLRNKGIAVMAVPFLLIATFMYLYYPMTQKENSFSNLETQVKTLSEMLAFSVGAGLNDGNFELVQTAFEWAKQDKNVVFISIIDETGESLIEYNPNEFKVNPDNVTSLQYDEDNEVLTNSVKINYNNTDFGKIVILYSLESTNAQITDSRITTLVIVGIILILATGFVTYVFNKISARVISLRDAAVKVSNGDMSIEIVKKETDELGDTIDAFNKMVANIKSMNEQLEIEKESVEKKVEEAVKQAREEKEYLSNSVENLLDKMEQVSSGDLTAQVEVNSDDDIGKLFKGFNSTISKIRVMLTEVNKNVEEVFSGTNEISSSAEEMAAGAQEQSSQTSEVASAIQEMASTILENSRNALSASEVSKAAKELSEKGRAKVEENKAGIKKISESTSITGQIISSLASKTEQIGEITQVIDDIADQTNLLALNAAIEAARAGEQGRGFAVVADEVRKLAERTTKATGEIGQTIKAIQEEAKHANSSMIAAKESVEDGEKITIEIGDLLSELYEASNKVAMAIDQVAAASEQQTTTADEVSRSIDSINSVISESARGVEQIAASATILNNISESLANMIKEFNLHSENQSYISGNGRLKGFLS